MIKRDPNEQVHWKYNNKFVKRFNLLTNTVSLCYVNSTVPQSHEMEMYTLSISWNCAIN